MKERTIYVADDGKEFDCYDDCIEYELSKIGGEMCFFDEERKSIPITQKAWDEAQVYYVCIIGSKGVEQMRNILSHYGQCKSVENILSSTIMPLVFYYDDDEDKWVDARDSLQKAKRDAQRLDDLIRTLESKTYMYA